MGADLTEYTSVLGKLNWLQSRTQFHISYHFSRCASAAASATIMDAKELNKVVRMVKDKPQRLLYAPIKGTPRLMGFPDAAYKNNADGSSQRGQCIFICQPRSKEGDTKRSLIDYESHKIKRTVLSTTVAELYAFMKCYGSAQFYRGHDSSVLYRSRPDLDQNAQGVVRNARAQCYRVEDASHGTL